MVLAKEHDCFDKCSTPTILFMVYGPGLIVISVSFQNSTCLGSYWLVISISLSTLKFQRMAFSASVLSSMPL